LHHGEISILEAPGEWVKLWVDGVVADLPDLKVFFPFVSTSVAESHSSKGVS
jgi:hypothetical protein